MTFLAQPTRNLQQRVFEECGINLEVPGGYVVSYSEWRCLNLKMYNQEDHNCLSVTEMSQKAVIPSSKTTFK